MRLVLLGAPGAGKGTQATRISERYKIPHISTGDIFRENIRKETSIGVLAKSYIDKGQLVPDEVTFEIVKNRLHEEDCLNGYLLDGFPRNLFQAEKLDEISKLDCVINIDVNLNILCDRITGRRICSKCNESYHISGLTSDKCPKCGGSLFQRADDNEVTVKSRLEVYNTQTQPLIEYYSNKGILKNVNGDQDIEKVFDEVKKVLG